MKEIKNYFTDIRKNLFIILIVSYSVLFFFAIISFTLTIFLYSSRYHSNRSINEEKEFFNYQHLYYDPSSGEIVSGFASLPRRLNSEEYVSYKGVNGGSNIISNFGADRYTCTGSCICVQEEEDGNRRNTATTYLARGLTIVFMSVSGIAAIEVAKQSFVDDCLNRFKDRCSETIKSTVEACKMDKGEKIKQKFHCSGKCQMNRELYISEQIKDAEEFNCERLDMDGEVEVEGYSNKIEKLASEKFKSLYLSSFCKGQSKIHYLHKTVDASDGEPVSLMSPIFRCSDGGKYSNPTVNCVPK